MEPFFSPCGIDCAAAPAGLTRPDQVAEPRDGHGNAAGIGSPDRDQARSRHWTARNPSRSWFSEISRKIRRDHSNEVYSRAS